MVILDVNLPDMDGYAVAAEVRDRFGGAVRLVALTGFSGSDEYARAGAAGFDSFIVKPAALKDLQDALKQRSG